MGYASLGFSGGPSVNFRIDPTSVEWNFTVNTTVIDTVAGRVVQVLGATLSDVSISGSYGQDVRKGKDGESWKLAEAFSNAIRKIQEHQSRDAREHRMMHQPATFVYSPRGWRFGVYVKDLSDATMDGSVGHRSGKFSYDYRLTLFIVDPRSDDLTLAGMINGDLSKARQRAIDEYIARISEGIGWHFSQYNGQVPSNPIGTLFGKDKFTDREGAAQQQLPQNSTGGAVTPP